MFTYRNLQLWKVWQSVVFPMEMSTTIRVASISFSKIYIQKESYYLLVRGCNNASKDNNTGFLCWFSFKNTKATSLYPFHVHLHLLLFFSASVVILVISCFRVRSWARLVALLTVAWAVNSAPFWQGSDWKWSWDGTGKVQVTGICFAQLCKKRDSFCVKFR